MSGKTDIKAIAFDLWGVLLTIDRQAQYAYWGSKLGLPVPEMLASIERYHADIDRGDITEAELWSNVGRDLGAKVDVQAAIGLWDHASGVAPRMELLDLADRLRKNGYKTGILTNLYHPPALKDEIYPHFDIVVHSFEVGAVKPEPRAYAALLERLGTDPAETVFIDDLAVNVEGANAVGIHGMVFEGSQQLVLDLAKLGIAVD